MTTTAPRTAHAKDSTIDDTSYFHGFLSRDDVDSLLPNKGDYLLRKSETQTNKWNYVLSLRCHDANKTLRHYVLHLENGVYQFRNNRPYRSAITLIEAHRMNKWPLDPQVPDAVLTKPISKDTWELDHKDLRKGAKLGNGQFGDVFEGTLNMRGKTVLVAIKTLRISTTDKTKIQAIMKEARLQRTLNHPNVTKLYGVACKQEPVMIVMELLKSGGSLDKFLREHKPSLETKLQFAKGAAKGLEYLHARGIIHRDIAARNCLYDSVNKQVKIGDFGLSVRAKQYTATNEKLPIKWLAPEVLSTTTFTSKSDVYAFGVLLYEIFSNGMPPYHDKTTAWVQQHVVNGGKLTMPQGTPDFIKKIADYCWQRNPDNRWDMKRVVEKMDTYIKTPKPMSTREQTQAQRSQAQRSQAQRSATTTTARPAH